MKIDVRFSWSDLDLLMFKQIKSQTETYVIDVDYVEDEQDFIGSVTDSIYSKHGIVCENDNYVKRHIVDYDDVLSKVFT